MSYDNSPYNHPEKHNLEIVGEIETNESYAFTMLVVWKNKDGELFYATDSGCSCPSPFEDLNSEADLTKIDKNHFDAFESEVMSFREEGGSPTADDRMQLIQKVKGLIF